MITLDQYQAFCEQLKTLCQDAAEKRRYRRALDDRYKKSKEQLNAAWEEYLKPYNDALDALTHGDLAKSSENAMSTERAAVQGVERLAGILMDQCTQLRLAGYEIPDPPSADRTSYVMSYTINVVDNNAIPATYWIVDTNALERDAKTLEIPGISKSLKVSLRVTMSDSDYERFGK